MRQIVNLLIFCLAVGSFQSCVSKKKYDELVAAKEATDKALAETQTNLKTLQEEKDALQAEYNSEKERLNGEISSIKSSLDATKAEIAQVSEKLNMTQAELDKLKAEINGAFSAYADSGLSLEDRNGQLYVVTSEAFQFRSGSTRLSKAQRNALDALAETLKANPKVQILVEGHTDDQKMVEGASYTDNWDLSVARAMKVIRYLVRKGVDEGQLAASGKGEFDPVGSNDTSEGRAENRRTVVKPNPNLGGLHKGNK